MKMKFLTALASLAFMGCASSYDLAAPTDLAPAAQAKLKIDEGKYGNRELTLNVNHLAPANKIDSAASTYVVWVKPSGSETAQNIGALSPNNNLSAKFKTQVAYDNFDFFVTAEPSPGMQEPSGRRIFEESITE